MPIPDLQIRDFPQQETEVMRIQESCRGSLWLDGDPQSGGSLTQGMKESREGLEMGFPLVLKKDQDLLKGFFMCSDRAPGMDPGKQLLCSILDFRATVQSTRNHQLAAPV